MRTSAPMAWRILLFTLYWATVLVSSVYAYDFGSVENLDSQITKIMKPIKRQTQNPFLTSGSVRSILKNAVRDSPLAMNDVDLAFIDSSITLSKAQSLASKITAQIPSAQVITVHAILRGNPELEGNARYAYEAGYTFIIQSEGITFDLSFFRSEADLNLSGLLSTDLMRIDLRKTNLTNFTIELKTNGISDLANRKIFIDPFGGYTDWEKRLVRVVNWTDVEGDASMMAVRIIRTMSDIEAVELPGKLKQKLSELVSSQTRLCRLEGDDAFGATRIPNALKKVLKDKNAGTELNLLIDLGVVGKWSPKIQEYLKDPNSFKSVLSMNSTEAWLKLKALHCQEITHPTRQ